MNVDQQVRRGPVQRLGVWLLWAVVLELLIVLTSLPGLLGLLFLDLSRPGHVPLAALCLVPLGPSLAAAVFAWNRLSATPRGAPGLAPAATFWRGYHLNLRDVLRWWVPVLAVLAALGYAMADAGLVFGDAEPGSVGAASLVYLVLAVTLVLWSVEALLLTALFSFRTRDIAKLAAYYLGARPLATLGLLGALVTAAAVVLFSGVVVLMPLLSLTALLLVAAARPVIDDATERFVVPDQRSGNGEPTADLA